MKCCFCGGSLDDSPSDDFCRQWCYEQWHAQRAETLTASEEFVGMGF